MILLYLSEAHLRNRLFVQHFVHNFKLKEKALLILDSFGGTVRDTRFVTRRLSTLLSEEMVYNNAFTAEQRDFFIQEAGEWKVRTALIEALLIPIQLLIIGPVVQGAEGPALADPLALVVAARQQLAVSELQIFTENPMSPLGSKRPLIQKPEDAEALLKIYEEEKQALELALALRPARVVSAPG